jgi:hypothetical protein
LGNVQDDRPKPAGMGEAFRTQIRRAGGRYRLERLARLSWPLAWSLTGALLVLLLLALATSVKLWALPVALIVLALGAIIALAIHRARVDRHRLLVRMDAHSHLPDAVLSAGDWETAPRDAWRERQRLEMLAALQKIDWRGAWPVRWPRLLWLPLACAALLTVALGLMQARGIAQVRAAALAEQVKPLEQVFQDWDAAQKIAPSPELAELMKQIQPMRAQMAAGQMTEKQLFLKLNEVQARLEAQRQQLEASSLEPLAQTMAAAMQNLDGMSGLAAALQRKDFAAAREQAAQAEQKYQSGTARLPEGANAQAAASKLGEAAQQASSGNPQASSALSQMQSGVANKNSSGMCHGLGGLKDSLGQQAQRQSQSHSLGLQLSQLSNCKNSMCQGSGIKMGLPALSLVKSLQEQKGAGSAVDPNRLGAQTQLDANHQEMRITGNAGEGASETQTESSDDPHSEQTASSVNAAQFSAYEKMSEQAAVDENLPVADRQMIKRYFEDIRPQSGP